MTAFKYTTNMKRGDEGSMVYWRTLWKLNDDPIASMLSERTLEGLAGAYHAGMIASDGSASFSRSGARVFAKTVIENSPLSLLSKGAIMHIANVMYRAIIVNDEE